VVGDIAAQTGSLKAGTLGPVGGTDPHEENKRVERSMAQPTPAKERNC
jgi:hypothetical protein